MYILPYFVVESEAEKYDDNLNLLGKDQRNEWWVKYGNAKGKPYNGIPDEIKTDNLTPITREPLLNYLIALSYERKKIDFKSATTLNQIYEDLLCAVYERQWEKGRTHYGIGKLKKDQFFRILEEIALTTWHGDGRTTTIADIQSRCNTSNLNRYLEVFSEGAEKGVSRLLTAFYFRQSGQLKSGDKTFEFTHKSFREYLTGKRIVRMVDQIHNKLKDHEEDPDDGYDEGEALRRWADLCGPTEIDEYLFKFLCDEIALKTKEIEFLQNTFTKFLGYAVRKGMPMEKLQLPTFKEMMRQSRNAEESLLVIHYACAIITKQVLVIDWGENTAFGEWIKRLQLQRIGIDNKLIMECLAFLDLSKCLLYIQDFFKANLAWANLRMAELARSDFYQANLQGANLQGANLINANLNNANLEEADLKGAKLNGADLKGADLKGADLKGADLKGANLLGAKLNDADLKSAKLQGAKLEE